MVRAREIFGPSGAAWSGTAGREAASGWWRLLKDFYRDPLAWVALLVTGLFTAYAGGAVMFWVHAVRLGEGGPDIPPTIHWALDSTAGFVGLTPALGLILPLAIRFAAVRHRIPAAARTWVFVLTAGTAFAVMTVPGPILHDALVARGTWVAENLTQLLGPGGGSNTPPSDVSTGVSMGYQFGIGLPTYIVCVGLGLATVRLVMTALNKIGS